jgi:hypothetical protein
VFRGMAAALGVSHQSVHRIWKNNDLKPHLRRTFKISSDPQFERKFWDVIGLYLNPPDKALVLAATKRASVRRWNERSRACPWESDTSAPARTTTNGMAPSRCLRR